MIPTEKISHLDEYFSPVRISMGKYKGVPFEIFKIIKFKFIMT